MGAALLVLLGLGLFVAGLMTGVEAFYWGCVAACGTAAVLLFLAQRQTTAKRGNARTTPGRDGDRPDRAEATTAAGSGAGVGTEPSPADGPAPAVGRPGGHAHAAPPAHLPDPPVEDVEVTDLLLVVDLTDEVLVLDEHPRYHLAGCVHLRGRTPIPLPLDEARGDGFTPCAVCAPDRHLAEQVRARKAAGNN
jgi:hypothetical protein